MKTDITIPQLKAVFLTKEEFKKETKKFVTKKYLDKKLEKFLTKDEFREAMSMVVTKREAQETARNLRQSIKEDMNDIMLKHLDVIADNTQTTREELAAMKLQTTRHDNEIKFLANTTKVNIPHF